MKSLPFQRWVLTLVGLLPLLCPMTSRACAVCMGGDENTGEALNNAIFVMLGCIFSMMALIASVAYSFYRRSKSMTPHLSV